MLTTADSKQLHSKGYEIKSAVTGVQAVILSPADDNAAGPLAIDRRHYTNPILASQLFLGESLPVRDLEPIDCTFWYTTEYLQSTGSAPWHTRVGTFQIPGCDDGIFADDFEIGTTDGWDQTVN